MYDIAIVGAGPAGATLARLLEQRYRVLLVDRRALDAPAVADRTDGKCCGGLLSANAQQALTAMGLTVPAHILTENQPATVRVIDADNQLERTYPRPYRNCHREAFDRWLISLIPAEVDLRFGVSVQHVCVEDDGSTLHLAIGKHRHTVRARLVVGADGAHSVVRRRHFLQAPAPRCYLAVQGWYTLEEPLPTHLAVFDRAVTDFYGWAIPKDGLLAIGAAVTPQADPHGHFARLLATLATAGVHPGRLHWREGALIQRPCHPRDICTGDAAVALIGEAAGWISPSSAEGFSYAFHSASALAEALTPGLHGAVARYTAQTQPLRRALVREMVKSTAMFTPWLRALALRAQGATPLVGTAIPTTLPGANAQRVR